MYGAFLPDSPSRLSLALAEHAFRLCGVIFQFFQNQWLSWRGAQGGILCARQVSGATEQRVVAPK